MVRLQTSASVCIGAALLLSTACASTPASQTQSSVSLIQATSVPTVLPSPTQLPQKDAVQLKCDALADFPYDPQRTGAGVALEKITVSDALPVCAAAASRQTFRGH